MAFFWENNRIEPLTALPTIQYVYTRPDRMSVAQVPYLFCLHNPTVPFCPEMTGYPNRCISDFETDEVTVNDIPFVRLLSGPDQVFFYYPKLWPESRNVWVPLEVLKNWPAGQLSLFF